MKSTTSLAEDFLATHIPPLVHYAPYGYNAIGEVDCGAKNPCGYTHRPGHVTCEKCKKLSPGLWPEDGTP